MHLLQLSKLTCIPVTLIIQFVLYKQTVSNSVKLTLIPITLGVGYATVYDLDLNFTGLGLCFVGNRCAGLACALSYTVIFLSFSCSVCDLCCYCDCAGSNLHQHLSEIPGVRCNAIVVSYVSNHRRGIESSPDCMSYDFHSMFIAHLISSGPSTAACFSVQGMLCMSPFFDDLGKLQAFEYTYRCKLNIGKDKSPFSMSS